MGTFEPDKTAKSLLADGSQAFNDHVAATLQTSLDRALPQMEVRVKHLTIAADVVVGRHDDGRELPTLTHAIKTAALKLSAKKHVVHKTILLRQVLAHEGAERPLPEREARGGGRRHHVQRRAAV